MPIITGVIGSGFGPPDAILAVLMSALARHEVDGARTDWLGPAHLGIQFNHTLPEDDFDRQPYPAQGERFLIVADGRVDNRDELATELGIFGDQFRMLSDAELIARGWERWELGLFNRLLGDVALASWDNVDGELTLARSPLSSRPIFFSQSADSVAFASLPSALCAVPAIGRSPDMDELARFLGGGLFQANMSSFFKAIQAVPQGTAICLKAGSSSRRALWSPGQLRADICVAEAGDLIRRELDRATRAQARRRSGPLALMLSSGRDSSAVAAAAAQLDKSSSLALTAAPRSAVGGLPPPWIADESEIAAKTAERLAIRQLTCRSEIIDLAALLDQVSGAHFQPFNNPVNLAWIGQLSSVARQDGASVMMTGAAGNFTISLGGPSFLSDFWRERGLVKSLKLSRKLRGALGLSWSQIATTSFGSLVTAGTYSRLRNLAGQDALPVDLPILREPLRRQAEAHRAAWIGDSRPKPSRRAYLAELAQRIEPADKYSLACWGIDIRDPTADRRLAELCLALPVEALIGRDAARPAYGYAFGEYLPEEVAQGRYAGAQAADWFETIRPDDVLSGYRRYARNAIVEELFDLETVESMVEHWPRSGAEADARYDEYCNQLLGGLAVASFINAHFGG